MALPPQRKIFRLFWVLLLALSCFTLGYTLRPKPDRRAMLQSLMRQQSRPMPGIAPYPEAR